jgi:alanine racemase
MTVTPDAPGRSSQASPLPSGERTVAGSNCETRTRLATDGDGHLGTAKRVAGWLRPAWVEVDLGAVSANVAHIRRVVAPSAVCAVVKADGYGHGAVQVALAALGGGATHLAVALAEEGHELRQAGIDVPVLVLSQPPVEAMKLVVEDGLTATIYTDQGLAALLGAVNNHSVLGARVPVHLKVDTGMHRVGATPSDTVRLAQAVMAEPALTLEGLFTHLAVADEPGNSFTAEQLSRFECVVSGLRSLGIVPPLLHAANSAGALCHPGARYQMVRPGMAVYGLAPAPSLSSDPAVRPLRPALSLKAGVTFVKEVAAGEALSYGLRYRLDARSVIATVPVGYADGVPRRLFGVGAEVLVGGRRRPVVGAVTMDQILVDCGPDAHVRLGDEVVLLGCQGGDEVTPWEWAEKLGTIAYEVTCALSPRLPRIYV